MATSLVVVGFRVLIKPDPIETKTESGIILNYGNDEARHRAGTQTGTIEQVGPMAWKNADLGYGTPGWEPWVKPGDRVLFSKYSGKFVTDPVTKEEYIVINDQDVQVKIGEQDA